MPRKKALTENQTDKEVIKGGSIERTADGRYIIIDGRRWRATDPHIPEEKRQQLVSELMKARRDVGRALREGNKELELEARARVHKAKVELGERGEPWWKKGSEDKQ